MPIDCRQPVQGQNPYYFYVFQTRTMVFSGLGTAVNSVFPLFKKVAVLDFQQPVGLFSLVLSSSVLNETAADTVGVAVGLDLGMETVNLTNGVNFFLTHLTRQNSTAAIRNANSKTNSMQMGQNTAYLLNSGQRLALYVCSANAAGNEITASVTAAWIPYQSQSGG